MVKMVSRLFSLFSEFHEMELISFLPSDHHVTQTSFQELSEFSKTHSMNMIGESNKINFTANFLAILTGNV